jgi:ATP-binding cassette subfamily D (ALD) protein 3
LLGWQGPFIIILWYFITVVLLRLISPSFGLLVSQEQSLEGQYRSKHSTLVSHSEEIAFYQGQQWEKTQVEMKFKELLKHQAFIMYKKLYMGSFDSMLVKYGATMCGYTVVGIPVFSKGSQEYLSSIKNNQS